MKFCIEFDPNNPSQLPSVQPGRPDNSLPGSQPGVDNSLPGGWPTRPDNSLPGSQPGVDNSLPGFSGAPDNSLPGVDKPVDPGYGVDPQPGSPDQSLPMPSPAKPFTDAEKREILRLAQQKFVNTDLAPMRAIVQAARWVLVTRKSQGADSGGAHPDQGLPKPPGTPDQGLPSAPGTPSQGLPPSPDQGLPSAPGTPGQLPGATPSPKSNY